MRAGSHQTFVFGNPRSPKPSCGAQRSIPRRSRCRAAAYRMKAGYVYIMASASRTTYVGVTSDLERRVWEHKTHFREGFTNRYNVTTLVYLAEFARIDDTIAWAKR